MERPHGEPHGDATQRGRTERPQVGVLPDNPAEVLAVTSITTRHVSIDASRYFLLGVTESPHPLNLSKWGPRQRGAVTGPPKFQTHRIHEPMKGHCMPLGLVAVCYVVIVIGTLPLSTTLQLSSLQRSTSEWYLVKSTIPRDRFMVFC